MTKEWIPNLNLGQDYDQTYADATVHFDKLGKLADFFGRDMPMHLHADFCQIHFVETGRTLFNIDQNTFATEGCALFYTPPSTPHAFLTDPDAPGYVITLHTSLLQTVMDRLHTFSNNNILFLPLVIEQRNTDMEEWSTIPKLFELLKAEWQTGASFNSEAIEAIIQLLLIHLLRLSHAQLPRYQNNQAEILSFRKFSRLIESHFMEQKRITFYCEQLNINESRLNYICKKIASSSPKKLINGRVILEAKRLLSHTNMHLNEIAYTLGYLDPSYFSRFFYKSTQMTPTDFRRENRAD